MAPTDLSELKQRLLYTFKNEGLLAEALRHSSFVNEQAKADIRDNERLEFLGDAVLNLVVGDLLMQRYPHLAEGDLSKTRANLVNEAQLAAIARKLGVGLHIQLGKGEIQTNGCEKNSILAGTFEAVVAAVYLDGGFDAVFKIIDIHFSDLLKNNSTPAAYHDYKSRVQEIVQMTHREIPVYTVVHENGPDHDKTFRIQLSVSGLRTEGVGKSKKLAEQDAARKCLELLKPDV
ncbi:MAG: ribonuclease III [Deltaproteobacteria bacterium]|nr:ribonuclease III [Deltaproteobacteria bacterium]